MTTPRVDQPNLAVSALKALAPGHLAAFLARQRWFAAKGAGTVPTTTQVMGVVPLPWGDGAFAIAIVGVGTAGVERVYQLPIAARPVPGGNLPAAAVIATSTVAGRTLTLFDATVDPEFQRGIVHALATNCVAEGLADDGLRWVVEAEGAQRLVIPDNAEIALGAAEQSNTSIIFDRTAILKLFRRIEPGIHPELEVSRFLTTHAGFVHTPTVLATMRFEHTSARGNGEEPLVMLAGIVQEYLPGATDAWTYALARAAPYFTALPRAAIKNEFVGDAKALGEITREMHDALASDESDPAFAPEDATPEDLDRWAHRAQQMVRDGLALLERQLTTKALPPDRLAEARILVDRRDRYLDWVNELADGVGDDLGARIRVHGDYHLGQVLRTAAGHFMVIDFEGEPLRTLADRRGKRSPLYDVAGMLRSLSYAAATLGASIERTADAATRELRSARWERDTRAAFLSGYLNNEDAAEGLLPDGEHVAQLISLFETEKAFYELAYELNHRPDWAWIPMRGISKLLVRTA